MVDPMNYTGNNSHLILSNKITVYKLIVISDNVIINHTHIVECAVKSRDQLYISHRM